MREEARKPVEVIPKALPSRPSDRRDMKKERSQ